jgi:hypothetical protein
MPETGGHRRLPDWILDRSPRFPGTFRGERELEEQVLRRQGDAPGDQVIPVSDLADVEIERVRNPAARLRGRGAGARRYLVDPWQQVGGGIGPALRHWPRLPDAMRPPDQLVREPAQHFHALSVVNSQLPKPLGHRRPANLAHRQIKPQICK